MATLDKAITENNIDAERIWNLVETGATPGQYANVKQSARVYITIAGAKDAITGNFLNANRVTIMPVISSAGCSGSPLFVFKGRRLRYHFCNVDGKEFADTDSQHLPRRSWLLFWKRLADLTLGPSKIGHANC